MTTDSDADHTSEPKPESFDPLDLPGHELGTLISRLLDGPDEAGMPVVPGYRLLRRIGEGGSSVVYEAIEVASQRRIALKIIRRSALRRLGVARFQREAAALAALEHPDIPSLLDFGPIDEQFYLALEYVEGRRLTDLLRSGEHDLSALLALLTDAADVVASCHARGIIHRDLKPSNILIRSDGRIAIVDFGIARGTAPGFTATLTQEGAAIGTPGYMSPEQRRGDREVTPASDVYALGEVLREAAAPHMSALPWGPRRALESLIARSTRTLPGERLADAAAFRRGLRRVQRHLRCPWLAAASRGALVLLLLVVAGVAVSALLPGTPVAPDRTAALLDSASDSVGRGNRPRVTPEGAEQMKVSTMTVLAVPYVGFVAPLTGYSADRLEDQKIVAPDGADGDLFGFHFAVHGDLLAVGAPTHDAEGVKSGAVYLYSLGPGGASFSAKLLTSDQHGGSYNGVQAGESCGFVDGSIVVAGPGIDLAGSDSGALYFFEQQDDQWVETQRLTPPDAIAWDYYGAYTCVSDTEVFAFKQRTVRVIRNDGSGWSETQTLTAPNGFNDWFGIPSATDGNRLVVGAPHNSDLSTRCGKAYIFERDAQSGLWNQTHTLLPSDGASYSQWLRFGNNVAVEGDRIVVGAGHSNYVSQLTPASAYVYEYDGSQWIETAKLVPSDNPGGTDVGTAVAIRGDTIWLGVMGHEWDGVEEGGVYRFDLINGEWTETEILRSRDALPEDNFGHPVIVNDLGVFVGAKSDGADGPGAVYFYAHNDEPTLTLSPTPLRSRELATFTVTGANPDAWTWLLYSADGLDATFIPQLNVIIDLEAPVIAGNPRRTDAAGFTEWEGVMPATTTERPLWFQSVQYENVTNVVATSLQP